jgi:hypothetical protein
MKRPRKRARWTAVLGIAVALSGGCGGREPAPVATQLQQSFENADAPTQERVIQATQALQERNYAQALKSMSEVAQGQPMDEAQKQALDNLIIEARQAAEKNPELNTPEFYQATTELFFRLHPEN